MRKLISLFGLLPILAFGQPFTFTDASWRSSYIANTAVADGTNDLMRLTSSGPTGLADGKVWTWSAWLKPTDLASSRRIFTIGSSSATQRLRVSINNLSLFVDARNGAGTTILSGVPTTLLTADSWNHVHIVCDMASSLVITLNGSVVSGTPSTFTNDTIDLIGTDFRYTVFGNDASTSADLYDGAIADMFFDDSSHSDVTLFRSAAGKPVELGSIGTGAVFYLKGSGDGFATNSGTGGAFTLTGALGTTTPP